MLHAVIMAGGSGTRFWPRSRKARPKQLLPIAGERSLIEETALRLGGLVPPERLHVITNARHARSVRRMLADLPPGNVVGEPVGRDTAAAVGIAAVRLRKMDPQAVMLLLPADHVISPRSEFERTVRAGQSVLEENPATLITFGIKPADPATGYGYIKREAPGDGATSECDGIKCYRIEAFKEKPGLAEARGFLEDGNYYWNAGIFLWSVDGILAEIRRQLPSLHTALEEAAPELLGPHEQEVLERVYPRLEKISIDYGVMESAADRTVVEATFRWDDVGSWDAIEKYHPHDDLDNVKLGEVVVLEGSGNIVDAADGVVALVGVNDLVVVRTGDAVLVCPKDRCQDVKRIVAELERRGRSDVL